MTIHTIPLAEEEVIRRLKQLPKWKFEDHKIQRDFEGKTYPQSIHFITLLGQLAEDHNHHPDLMMSYKKVTIQYWTHTAKGVTDDDIDMAHHVENLIHEFKSKDFH